VFVIDVDDIDDANQSFTANFYLRLRWNDKRLANPGGSTRQIRLEEIWNPRLLLANQQGRLAKALPDVAQVEPDGMVIYHQRYTGNLSQPLDLSRFPMDAHSFTIHFVAAGYTDDQLEFLPDTHINVHGGAISDDLSLPGWEVVTSLVRLSISAGGAQNVPILTLPVSR
jgi:hypothetical protein